MKVDKIILLAAATAVMSLASCRKELCYNHFRTAEISLAWEQEWERDYGMSHSDTWDAALHGFEYHELRPGLPEWVTLLKYLEDGTIREEFLEVDGGEIPMDETGAQSFLLYNGDTEFIILSDMASHATARATTTTRTRATLTYTMQKFPGSRSINPPDMLYAAYVEDIPYIDVHEVKTMPVRMQPLVYTYVIRYEFEHGLDKVALARGALGGMAESVYLRNGTTSDNPSIILYDCDIKSYGCEARVNSFGVPGFPDEYYGRADGESEPREFTLNLEVLLNNGKTLQFDYDISDQIEKQPRGGVIRISGIRIEDEEGMVDSGFKVNVDDWGEHEDIEMPDDMWTIKN